MAALTLLKPCAHARMALGCAERAGYPVKLKESPDVNRSVREELGVVEKKKESVVNQPVFTRAK